MTIGDDAIAAAELLKLAKVVEAAVTALTTDSEPDPKVVERYQYVVIQPSLQRDGMDHGMDRYRSGGA